MMRIVNPEGWPRPKGYANAISAKGRLVFVAGQIGWTAEERFESDDFIDQTRQALRNVLTVLAAAEAKPEHVARMTWYVTDKRDYLSRGREVGVVYRELMGKHYPAMTLIEVSALAEDRAKVEVEVTAVVPDA